MGIYRPGFSKGDWLISSVTLISHLITADIFAVLLRYFYSSIGNLIINFKYWSYTLFVNL